MTLHVETLISEEQIRERVVAMAGELAPQLRPGTVVISLLKGAFVFAADLVRELARHGVTLHLDFMVLSSYGRSTQSSGRVTVHLDCKTLEENQEVLLLDDILDTGNTLTFAVDHLRQKGAKRIVSCVLLDKPSRRQTDFEADVVGFTIPDQFVVGYGIDYAEKYRELPFVGYVTT